MSKRRNTTIQDIQFTPAPGKRRLDSLRQTIRPVQGTVKPSQPPLQPAAVDMSLWLPETPERMTLKRPARLKTLLVYAGVIALAMIIGVSFYFQAVGQWVIVGAGIAGIAMRINSIVFFAAALFALAIVVIMTIGSQAQIASNYAVYAYLLLAFGTFHSIFNLQRPETHLTATR